MNWRAKFGVLVLTHEEQRTIAFIVLALVLGLATMHYRHTHRREINALQKGAAPLTSPSPAGERVRSR